MAHPLNAIYDKLLRVAPLLLLGLDGAALIAAALLRSNTVWPCTPMLLGIWGRWTI